MRVLLVEEDDDKPAREDDDDPDEGSDVMRAVGGGEAEAALSGSSAPDSGSMKVVVTRFVDVACPLARAEPAPSPFAVLLASLSAALGLRG